MDKRKSDVSGLPTGWIREEVVRKSGLSAGKTDVYYYSPDGRKIRSKPMLARILGDSFDLSAFDFRSGRIISSALRKSKRQKGSAFDFARETMGFKHRPLHNAAFELPTSLRGMEIDNDKMGAIGMRHDSSLVLPIRQTASIFKQPVTVIRNRPESKTKTDIKHGNQDQPKQLFWEKRLQGLHARDNMEDIIQSLELPRNVQGIGPDLTTENILQSISAALHLNSIPVMGQNANKSTLQKNPGVHIDANQPHIQQLMVSDEDIRRQELRVQEARRRLQEVMKQAA